jgi:hypothetical protein
MLKVLLTISLMLADFDHPQVSMEFPWPPVPLLDQLGPLIIEGARPAKTLQRVRLGESSSTDRQLRRRLRSRYPSVGRKEGTHVQSLVLGDDRSRERWPLHR